MENSVKNVQKLKIILLGDSGVGKTCLINQYVHENFQKSPILDFHEPLSKMLHFNAKDVNLQICDTGGRERHGGLEAAFFNNTSACMLVYDVNDPHSLENLENWHNEFNIKAISNPSSSKKFPFVVLGNKVDIYGSKQVYPERKPKWCQDKGIAHFFTSAKDYKSVAKAFEYVVELALNYETTPSLPAQNGGNLDPPRTQSPPPKSSLPAQNGGNLDPPRTQPLPPKSSLPAQNGGNLNPPRTQPPPPKSSLHQNGGNLDPPKVDQSQPPPPPKPKESSCCTIL